jgi:transcriptional regulator with XRE-family HTH domain
MSPQTSTNTQTSQVDFWKSAEFCHRLRAERVRKGLNQKDFAALGGATLDSQSRYETGKNQPSAEYLARLASNRVDVSYLLTGVRGGGDSLASDAAQLLNDYHRLPADKQDLARALIRTMVEQQAPAADAPRSTVHSRQFDYRGEDRI